MRRREDMVNVNGLNCEDLQDHDCQFFGGCLLTTSLHYDRRQRADCGEFLRLFKSTSYLAS
jgi:hypothetical protein